MVEPRQRSRASGERQSGSLPGTRWHNEVQVTANLRPSADAALVAYGEIVLAHRAQVDRVTEREPAPERDRWAKRAADFRPGRMDAPEIGALGRLARPSDTWIDVGAGAGRFAIPLSESVSRVIAVEPSAGMRAQLEQAVREAGRGNIDIVAADWPPPADSAVDAGDAVLVANVLYGVADLGPFLEAAESHCRRMCVVIASDRAPSSPLPEVWEAVHGEPFSPLPALRELLAVLLAMGRQVDVEPVPVPMPPRRPLEQVLDHVRRIYHVSGGSKKDRTLLEILERDFRGSDGLVRMPAPERYSSVVSWLPPV